MGYDFTCQLTAQFYQLGQAIGLPLEMAGSWYRFGAESFLVDGEGRLSSAAGTAGASGLAYPSGTSWRDYTFVVPAIAPRQTNTGAWGVCFRFTSPGSYYYLLWDGGELGWTHPLRLGKVGGGVETVLAEADERWSGDAFYLLRVDLYGSRLLVSANSRVLFDYTDQNQPLLSGAPGILTSSCLGVRFGGVYAEGIRPLEVGLTLSGTLDPGQIGPAYAVCLNNTPVYILCAPLVQSKAGELNVPPERLFVYRYRISTGDVFVQPYFNLAEPVVYTATGDCRVYAYLKAQPRVPEAPANLTGTLVGDAILWRWEDRSAVEQGYRLYDEGGRLIATLGASVTQYQERATTDGTTYVRQVKAYNSVGESAPAEGSVYVDVIPPGTPAWFSGSGLSQTDILWQWAAVDNAETYELYDGQNSLLATIPAGATSYREENLHPDQVYVRLLVACRKGLRSAPVTAVASTLPEVKLPPPPPVTVFSGTPLGETAIRWAWEYDYPCVGFVIYGQDGTVLAELGVEERSWTEAGLVPGMAYTRYLRVKGEDSLSDPVSASVLLEWEFVELPCREYPAPVRRGAGLASGVGDGDDLLTAIEAGAETFRCTALPVRLEEETEEVPAAAVGSLRFTATGTEPYTVDNGYYRAELTVGPEVQATYTVQAQAVEPVDLTYRVEGDVRYAPCDPVEKPFTCRVKGYGLKQDVPPLEGTYRVNCRARVTTGADIPFNYRLKVVYKGPPSAQNKPLVDVVWVIDYSGSMSGYMTSLANNAAVFFDALNQHNIDFRLGVTGFEVTAYKRLTASGAEWTTNLSEFQIMVQIPTTGGTEYGLTALQYALNNYSWRSGATRYLVILTDENADDYSSSFYSTVLGLCRQTGAVVAAIYNFSDATPYPDLVSQTGGIGLSIGSSNWGQGLADLAANIATVAAVESTIGSGGSGDPVLTAVARYGTTYQATDGQTLAQIVAAYLASGGTGLPADLYTNPAYTVERYELIPPASPPFVLLSNGSLQDTTGSATVQAYSTATVTQEVNLSTAEIPVSVPAAAYGPATAVVASSQTCRELFAATLQQYVSSHPECLSVTPVAYWCTGSGNVAAYNTLPNGEDSPLVYRRDWSNVIATYEAVLAGTLTKGHTAAAPLVVDTRTAAEILNAVIPINTTPLSEFSVLPRLAWARGYAPFDGFASTPYCTPYVLVSDPSLCYFLKDIWLEGSINSAEMRIGSDDGIILYVNGQEVLNRRADAHGVHYWDYVCDIKPFLRQGRNRIAVLVDNGLQNAGSASGGFDAELVVDLGGTVIYPIKNGKNNWRSPESVWWYYGHESTLDAPPADVFGRPWYHQDYGLVNLHAIRAESDTPGVAVYINETGLVCAYPTVALNTCEVPVECTCALTVTGQGIGQDRQLAAFNYSHPAWALALSGPGTVLVSPEQAIAALTPLADLHIAASGLVKLVNLVYGAAVSGPAAVSGWDSYGRCSIALATAVNTYQPAYVDITVASDPFSYAGLRDSATAAQPADVSGGVSARDILAPYLGGTPPLTTYSYTVSAYRAVLLSGEAVVSTAADGSGPVLAYPTRTTDYTGSWTQTARVYAYEGNKVVAATADFVPVDKTGQPYTGEKTTWTLAGVGLPSDVQVFWSTTGAAGTVETPAEVVVTTNRKAARTIEGVATPELNTYGTADLAVGFAGDPTLRLHIRILEKRVNVFFALASNPAEVVADGAVTAVDDVVVWAERYTFTRPWQAHGPWRQVTLPGEEVFVLLDLEVPPHIQNILYGYDIEAEVPVAAHFGSGGQQTADPADVLYLSCSHTRTEKRTRQVPGVPVADGVARTLAAGEESTFTITVEEGCWPPGTGTEELLLRADNPNVSLSILSKTETVAQAEPGVDNRLGDVPNYPLWRLAGLTLEQEAGVPPGRLLGARAFVYEVLARVVNPRAVPLNPVVRDGFYYLSGEERYLHGAATVTSQESGPVPVVRDAVCLVCVRAASGEEVPLLEFATRCPADGEWHALTPATLLELYKEAGGTEEAPLFEVVPAVAGLELAYAQTGETAVSGRFPLETDPVPRPLAPVVAEDMTVRVRPVPVGDGPVVVTTQTGRPLRYAPFFDTFGEPCLEKTEVFSGGGTDTVALAFLGIDPATLQVEYTPAEGEPMPVTRFQLCNHRLRVPLTLQEGDLLKVTYRLRDSFNFRCTEDGLTILLHTGLVAAGEPVLVSYETEPERRRRFAEADVSPLRCPGSGQFVWLADEAPGQAEQIELAVWPLRPKAGEKVRVHAVVTDGEGCPLAGQKVTFTCGGGPAVEAKTDGSGTAAATLTVPAGSGPADVVAVCGNARSAVGILPEQPVRRGLVEVACASSAVLPGTEVPVLVSVYDEEGVPLAGSAVTLSADRGTIFPASGQTDALGRIRAVFTAGGEEGLATILAQAFVYDTIVSGLGRIMTKGFISAKPVADNCLADVPNYSLERLGSYSLDVLAHTPASWL